MQMMLTMVAVFVVVVAVGGDDGGYDGCGEMRALGGCSEIRQSKACRRLATNAYIRPKNEKSVPTEAPVRAAHGCAPAVLRSLAMPLVRCHHAAASPALGR